MILAERLSEAKDTREIFILVTEAIESSLGQKVGKSRLVVEDLPSDVVGFIAKESKTIVLNKALVDAAQSALASSDDSKAVLFVLLTHGCLRNLGYEDETIIMNKAQLVTRLSLGPEHKATRVATGLFPMLSSVDPVSGDEPPDEMFRSNNGRPSYLG